MPEFTGFGGHMKISALKQIAAVSVALLAVGCASGSKDIGATYVSPMAYQGYSCEQLVAENQRIQTRISLAAGDVDKKAHGDKVKMGVGLVLFWPALFFLKGDGAEAQEYARLKGEHEAFESAYVQKNCMNVSAANAAKATPSASDVP